MAEDQLGIAVIPIRATMDKLDSDLSAARGKIQKATGRMSKVLKTIGKAAVVGIAGATVAVASLGAAMGKLAFDAMPIEGIQKAFQGLTDDADETMRALRSGSLGMVRDAELMRNYNEATQLVSKSFADDLPDAMGFLSKVSAATGQDMGFLVDSLTRGIGRLQPLILDNLSIQVDATKAYDDYAKAIGKSADDLTKQEKQTALMNQVMVLLAENTAKMPDITENAATKWAQLTTTLGNVKDQIGVALLPLFTPLISKLAELAQTYLPQLVTVITERVIPAFQNIIEQWGPKLTEALDAIVQFVQSNWPVLETAFDTLVTAAEGVFNVFKSFYEEIQPKLQPFWDALIESLSAVAELVDTLTGDTETGLEGNKQAWMELTEQAGIFMASPLGAALEQAAWSLGILASAIEFITGLMGGLSEETDEVTLLGQIWNETLRLIGKSITIIVGGPFVWMKTALDGIKDLVRTINSLSMSAIISDLERIGGLMPNLGGLGGLGGLLGLQHGGMVPGPMGMPQLAVVHGGELVVTAEQQEQQRDNYYFNQTVNTRAEQSTVIQDFNIMQSMLGVA